MLCPLCSELNLEGMAGPEDKKSDKKAEKKEKKEKKDKPNASGGELLSTLI